MNMEYTEKIYVDVNIGNDTTGVGTELSPFLTVSKAIKSVKTNNPIIYLSDGNHNIFCLQDLSITGKTITIKGNNLKTTLIVKSAGNGVYYSNFFGNLNIMNLIITRDVNSVNDTRMICYSTDFYIVNYINCVFKQNTKGIPNFSWFLFNNTSSETAYFNKNFLNCLFTSNLTISSIYGVADIANCATESASFGNVRENTGSMVNCLYSDKYKLINNNNSLYGVYSGINSWEVKKYILKNNNHYYTVKSEYYLNNQYNFIPELEGKTLLAKTDYDTYGFKTLNALTQNTTVNSETFRPIDILQKQFNNIDILQMKER